MTITVPEPTDVEWNLWAATFINANPALPNVPIPQEEAGWSLWASEVCLLTELQGYQLPWPQGFATWREWARRLSEALVGGL